MCLGIPGQIAEIVDAEKKLARVEVAGVGRVINLAPILGTSISSENSASLAEFVGCWVLVHVGFAMSVIDEADAEATLQLLEELGEAQEEIRLLQGDPA